MIAKGGFFSDSPSMFIAKNLGYKHENCWPLVRHDTGLDKRVSQPLNWSSTERQYFESLQRSLRTFVRTRGCYGCVKMSVHFFNTFVSIREEHDPDDDKQRGQDDRTSYFLASPKSEHRSCECCTGPKFIVRVFSEFGPPVPLALDASATVNDLKA